MFRSWMPILAAVAVPLILPSLVGCGPDKGGGTGTHADAGQDGGATAPLQETCETFCRHLLGCWGADDPGELSACTSDVCEGAEGLACEGEARAFLECASNVSCEIITSEADLCEAEEAAWDECDAENPGSLSTGESGSGESGSTGPGYGVWGCSYERKTRVACPGVNDPGEWTPRCSDVYALDEADAQRQCSEMTTNDTSCDGTGCCYETRFQAVELIPGGC